MTVMERAWGVWGWFSSGGGGDDDGAMDAAWVCV